MMVALNRRRTAALALVLIVLLKPEGLWPWFRRRLGLDAR